jgi:isocitrate/isopropylmalate dehydrogenase
MLQLGLYPIVSRETGITLPDGCGIYLTDCSVADIESAVRRVGDAGPREVAQQTRVVQDDASRRYSRAAFAAAAERYLGTVTG